MATVKQTVGTKTARTVTGLGTLANSAYATSVTIDNTVSQPSDLLVELTATPGTVSGNKQAVIFAIASLDGTNFQSGANAADEAVMTLIGVLSLASNATSQTKPFSVAASFGGILPPYLRIVIKNESGAAFSSGSISTADIILTVT